MSRREEITKRIVDQLPQYLKDVSGRQAVVDLVTTIGSVVADELEVLESRLRKEISESSKRAEENARVKGPVVFGGGG